LEENKRLLTTAGQVQGQSGQDRSSPCWLSAEGDNFYGQPINGVANGGICRFNNYDMIETFRAWTIRSR
jgi:hypothetical protein